VLEILSNFLQLVGYVAAPILLGFFLYYGIQQSRRRKPTAVQAVQDEATKRVYAADNRELERKAEAAKNSSNPIDVIERKTDTLG
jgi:hypothetical protein